MKRYAVVLEESAQTDVRKSYDWGCRVWSKRETQKWVRELRTATLKQLRIAPTAFPRAPEDNDFTEEIRQMIVGRHRILFTIKGRKVHVLHLRGHTLRRSIHVQAKSPGSYNPQSSCVRLRKCPAT
jgi:plasmid stabilization system protein ParE